MSTSDEPTYQDYVIVATSPEETAYLEEASKELLQLCKFSITFGDDGNDSYIIPSTLDAKKLKELLDVFKNTEVHFRNDI